jgi:hypothetical protein
MLLIMGGVMNVYAEDQHPWLANEIRAIRDAVDFDKRCSASVWAGRLARALEAERCRRLTRDRVSANRLTEAGQRSDLCRLARPAVEWRRYI